MAIAPKDGSHLIDARRVTLPDGCVVSGASAVDGVPAGEAALQHNLTATIDPESIGGIPRQKAAVLPSVAHLRRWSQNNRVENSHQPVRWHERGLHRFKSLRHAARFCAVFSTVCNQFRPGRHALSAANYRAVMQRRWREWDAVSETAAFAAVA